MPETDDVGGRASEQNAMGARAVAPQHVAMAQLPAAPTGSGATDNLLNMARRLDEALMNGVEDREQAYADDEPDVEPEEAERQLDAIHALLPSVPAARQSEAMTALGDVCISALSRGYAIKTSLDILEELKPQIDDEEIQQNWLLNQFHTIDSFLECYGDVNEDGNDPDLDAALEWAEQHIDEDPRGDAKKSALRELLSEFVVVP